MAWTYRTDKNYTLELRGAHRQASTCGAHHALSTTICSAVVSGEWWVPLPPLHLRSNSRGLGNTLSFVHNFPTGQCAAVHHRDGAARHWAGQPAVHRVLLQVCLGLRRGAAGRAVGPHRNRWHSHRRSSRGQVDMAPRTGGFAASGVECHGVASLSQFAVRACGCCRPARTVCAVPLLSLNTAVEDDVIDHAGQSLACRCCR